MKSSLSLRGRGMDKKEVTIARAICEIKCVCISSDDECVGDICGSMAKNIIEALEETPQNPEYRLEHLSEEPVG